MTGFRNCHNRCCRGGHCDGDYANGTRRMFWGDGRAGGVSYCRGIVVRDRIDGCGACICDGVLQSPLTAIMLRRGVGAVWQAWVSHGLWQWTRRVAGQELQTCRERLQWNAFAVGRLGGEVTVSEQPRFVRR